MNRTSTMTLAIALVIASMPAMAQHHGHDMSSMPGMTMPKPASAPAKKPPAKKQVPKPSAKPAPPMTGMDHSGMDMSGMDHAAMGHAMPAPSAPAKKPSKAARNAGTKPAAKRSKPAAKPTSTPAAMDHGSMAMPTEAAPGASATEMPGMDHSQMEMSGMDHSQMDMSGTDHSQMDMSGMDHSQMDMSGTDHSQMDMSGMDHSQMDMSGMDHSQMDMSGMDHSQMDMSGMDHSQMDMSGMDHGAMAMPGMTAPGDLPATAEPRTPVRAVTDADRAAAFPSLGTGHAAHDKRSNSYWLVDRLEVVDSAKSGGWEGLAWIGGDIHRAWLRTEGDVEDGQVEHGNLEVLYGRSFTPWWDAVAGIRQDVGQGPDRTWAAVGVQGLAPYKFEVEATAYFSGGGRTAATLEAEYDTLLTNRLILQWQGEANLYGRDDPARGLGSGLSTVTAGARLRYEVTRRFAPYLGIEVERAFGDTATWRRADGFDSTDTRVVAGIRFWF